MASVSSTSSTPTLIRHKVYGWRGNLQEVVSYHIQRPFEWGDTDCALLAARTCKAIVGDSSLLSMFEGKYHNPLGAVRILKKNGYESLKDVADKNFNPIGQHLAHIGDLVLVESTYEHDSNVPKGVLDLLMGILLGDKIGVMTLQGYGLLDRHHIKFAYKMDSVRA